MKANRRIGDEKGGELSGQVANRILYQRSQTGAYVSVTICLVEKLDNV